jgi:hypothetical protein
MLPEEEPLDELARRAGQGDKEALEGICRADRAIRVLPRPDPSGHALACRTAAGSHQIRATAVEPVPLIVPVLTRSAL